MNHADHVLFTSFKIEEFCSSQEHVEPANQQRIVEING